MCKLVMCFMRHKVTGIKWLLDYFIFSPSSLFQVFLMEFNFFKLTQIVILKCKQKIKFI